MALFLFSAGQGQAALTFYVSPAGNDAWSGKLREPNASKTDGPFATPMRARDAAKMGGPDGDANEPITIILRGGTYFLPSPLTFSPENSGTVDQPTTWRAEKDEQPILSGGQLITGWQETKVNGQIAWMAKLPDGDHAWIPRQLWVNGQPMSRSRWPKKGTLVVPKQPAIAASTGQPAQPDYRRQVNEFQFDGDDLKSWPKIGAAELIVGSRWVESRLPIDGVNENDHIVHFTRKSVFNVEAGDRYWLENVKEKLSEPGEFYVDPQERVVYLIPPSGISLQSAQVIVPSIMQVMRLEGDPANSKFVHDIIFRGITFAHSEWGFERLAPSKEPITGYHQAAIGVPGAIWGEGVRNCTFDHCTIADVGSYGIELGRACQHNRITHCDIHHTGAGGIKVGETMVRASEDDQASHNEISDCTIADGGNLFPSCVAVWIGQSHDNTIAHNDIHGFWYTAISMGWTWGYGKSAAQHNLVEYNHIHHIGIKTDDDQPILSDLGGIYTLGNQEGGMIRFNKFHDMAAIKYGGWGIYFDEGTTHLTAEKNLVYRTTHGGFHQHYGKENVVGNNIFAFGRDAQIQRTRVEEHTSFTFERNIVDWDRGNLFAGNWSKENAIFDYNTYWNGGGQPIRFGKKTWEQWRATGMDEHSKIADPKFADPRHGDFTPTNRDALPQGFELFDLSNVGPR